jgi:DNA-binding CsgD family transcriptional regulator
MRRRADNTLFPPWPPSPALEAQLSEMRQLIATWTELLERGLRDVSAIEQRLYGLQLAYNHAAAYAIAHAPSLSLTARERQVLALAARRLKNREIGRELGIGEGAVKNHMTNILSKLSARNRREAVALARILGVI